MSEQVNALEPRWPVDSLLACLTTGTIIGFGIILKSSAWRHPSSLHSLGQQLLASTESNEGKAQLPAAKSVRESSVSRRLAGDSSNRREK